MLKEYNKKSNKKKLCSNAMSSIPSIYDKQETHIHKYSSDTSGTIRCYLISYVLNSLNTGKLEYTGILRTTRRSS